MTTVPYDLVTVDLSEDDQERAAALRAEADAVLSSRSLADRVIDFALAVLLNQPPELMALGMMDRARAAVEFATTVARYSGDDVTDVDQHQLAHVVYASALCDLDKYGRK